MVSPFKIAREAALDKTAGGTKFLGEALSWLLHRVWIVFEHLVRSCTVLLRIAPAMAQE